MKFKKLLKEATRRSLNEKSLNRIGQHLKGDRPFAMITAFRGEYTKKQNVERNKSMASKIKNMEAFCPKHRYNNHPVFNAPLSETFPALASRLTTPSPTP